MYNISFIYSFFLCFIMYNTLTDSNNVTITTEKYHLTYRTLFFFLFSSHTPAYTRSRTPTHTHSHDIHSTHKRAGHAALIIYDVASNMRKKETLQVHSFCHFSPLVYLISLYLPLEFFSPLLFIIINK